MCNGVGREVRKNKFSIFSEFFLPKYFVSSKIVLNFATANGNKTFPQRKRNLKIASLAQLARARDL